MHNTASPSTSTRCVLDLVDVRELGLRHLVSGSHPVNERVNPSMSAPFEADRAEVMRLVFVADSSQSSQ